MHLYKPGRPERFFLCPERFCPDSLSERAASDCSPVPSVRDREMCNTCVNASIDPL